MSRFGTSDRAELSDTGGQHYARSVSFNNNSSRAFSSAFASLFCICCIAHRQAGQPAAHSASCSYGFVSIASTHTPVRKVYHCLLMRTRLYF